MVESYLVYYQVKSAFNYVIFSLVSHKSCIYTRARGYKKNFSGSLYTRATKKGRVRGVGIEKRRKRKRGGGGWQGERKNEKEGRRGDRKREGK